MDNQPINNDKLPHEKMEEQIKALIAKRKAREKEEREKKVVASIDKLAKIIQLRGCNPLIIKEAVYELKRCIDQYWVC